LGEEISDMMQDPENYLKAFALLKNPVFAELMESTESVHRSFAEVMKDNGEEKMMFGILEMIKDFGGLVGFQESTQINQNNSSVNIRA
jgi:DNA-binding phage protein